MTKTVTIAIRVTDKEAETLKKAAKYEGLALAPYCKSLVFKGTREAHPELFKEEKN